MSKKCTPDKILTPKNRCVSRTGPTGLKLLAKSSKKCTSDKILTPKNRCVSRTGPTGLKLLAKPLKKSTKIKDPLSLKYRNICDVGLVSKKVNPLLNDISIKTGEIHDVYCVANNNKKLAALDYSSYGKKKFLKYPSDVKLINKIIDYSNYKNVQYLHNQKTGGMYLKSIFFLPENYNEALKLMYLLWYYKDSRFDPIEKQISIGLLLDYSHDNIIFFCKDKMYAKITKKKIKLVENKLKKLKITLDMLQKDYKIVHKSVIENLKTK